jgi:hypothetical protein
MNIITPDALLTDIVLDITDHEALAEVLADLGIDPTLNF